MIYICIPAHNEARTVGVLLWKIRTVLGEFQRDYQILVVDDASDDGTDEVLAPYARVLPLHIRRNKKQAGYAAALEQAVREAVLRAPYPKRDVVVTLQADFTEEPGQIPDLVKRIEGGADVVTGEMSLGAHQGPNAVRWSRRAWSYLLRRSDWEGAEHDPLSGFRAYRVMVLKKALEAVGDQPLLTMDGWAANAQLLAVTLPHARRAEDVPVDVRYDRRERPSRFHAMHAARQIIRLMRARGDGAAAVVDRPDVGGTWQAPERHTDKSPDNAGRRRRGRRGRGKGGKTSSATS
ncbi:MAG: glycosyltransferase family 2 protein [Gemmatimonadota bacterium]